MRARWLVVLVTAAALVGIPVACQARPVADPGVSPADLVARIQASADRPWSGYVETSGALQVPDSDSFVGLAQLLGEDNDLRVWWRAADDWRIDRIRSTGETDLIRRGPAHDPLGVRVRGRDDLARSRRSGCPTPPTCCRRRWPG